MEEARGDEAGSVFTVLMQLSPVCAVRHRIHAQVRAHERTKVMESPTKTSRVSAMPAISRRGWDGSLWRGSGAGIAAIAAAAEGVRQRSSPEGSLWEARKG